MTESVGRGDEREAWWSDMEGHHEEVLRALPCGVVIHDQRGRVVALNPTAEEILGRPISALRGASPEELGWEAIDENGVPLSGALPYEAFEQVIEGALEGEF